MKEKICQEKTGLHTEYKRDLNHNYLLVRELDPKESDEFYVRMISENKLSCLLPMEIRYEDGEEILYYEISSLQSLKRIYENKDITGEELRMIFYEISKMFEQLKEYLLCERHVVILPEYIFMNLETKKIKFLYYPYQEQDIYEVFQEFSEFILDRIDHQDSQAVLLAYQFYKIIRNENFVLSEIRDLCEGINSSPSENEFVGYEKITQIGVNDYAQSDYFMSAKPCTDSMNRENNSREYDRKTISEKKLKDNKNENKSKAILIFIGITVLSIFYLVSNKNPINTYSNIISIGFMVVGVLGIFICLKTSYWITLQQLKDGFVNNTKNKADNEYQKISDEEEIVFQNIVDEDMNPNYGKTMFCIKEPEKEERVLVEKKHGKEFVHKLEAFPFTIGKMKDLVDLPLSDYSVSRMHARIFEEDGYLYVTDLGSTNGTYLNGISINQEEKLQLETGDELRVGKVEFLYR